MEKKLSFSPFLFFAVIRFVNVDKAVHEIVLRWNSTLTMQLTVCFRVSKTGVSALSLTQVDSLIGF